MFIIFEYNELLGVWGLSVLAVILINFESFKSSNPCSWSKLSILPIRSCLRQIR